jgi:hypothetical protein
MQNLIVFLLAHKEVILMFLLSLSEVLALSPKIKANSVFELVIGLVKKALGK